MSIPAGLGLKNLICSVCLAPESQHSEGRCLFGTSRYKPYRKRWHKLLVRDTVAQQTSYEWGVKHRVLVAEFVDSGSHVTLRLHVTMKNGSIPFTEDLPLRDEALRYDYIAEEERLVYHVDIAKEDDL